MNDMLANRCDDALLARYADNDLGAADKKKMKAHLDDCRTCRRRLTAWSTFSQDLRDRVAHESGGVDFTALEKDVLTKALRPSRTSSGGASILKALKFGIPAVVTACLILFLGYNRWMAPSGPAPSAIINSFTGSMSSVMIFETPETRQTILWYNEDTDKESESNAV